MKLVVNKYTHEPPEMAIIPETEYEAAILQRYWDTAELTVGKSYFENGSINGYAYGIKFRIADKPSATERPATASGVSREQQPPQSK